MDKVSLEGMRVLVMEDEFLIAMDVEQLCRDHGATEVVIARNLDELGPDPFAGGPFHAAILDVMLAGHSTIGFAGQLRERRIPFVFATAYTEGGELSDAMPDVEIVPKPYGGPMLISALARAIGRLREPSGGV